MSQAGFFDFEDRLAQLNAKGNPLEVREAAVDFEAFRPTLAKVWEKEWHSEYPPVHIDPEIVVGTTSYR